MNKTETRHLIKVLKILIESDSMDVIKCTLESIVDQLEFSLLKK
jgi:hypothetical protein